MMEDNNVKVLIGKRLQELRIASGVSLNKIALKLGTSYDRVKKMESGECNYTIDTLIQYMNVVDINFDVSILIRSLTLNEVKPVVPAPIVKDKDKGDKDTSVIKDEVKIKVTSFKPVSQIDNDNKKAKKKPTVIEDAD